MGDGSMTLIFSDLVSVDFAWADLASADLASTFSSVFASAFASALASVFASVFPWAFSTTAGRSAAVFSMTAFSEIPLALTPAAGRLLTLAVVSAGLASDLASALPSPLGLAVDAVAAGASVAGLLTM